ncbi:MAG: Gfo/Idh/MocA family protein [Pirellulaceae bacterium]
MIRSPTGPSRRTFLQTSAVLAAPMMIPVSAWGQALQRRAPSDRITVGLIGCGKISKGYHLPELLQQPDVQVVAVCEVDQNRRELFQQLVNEYYTDGKQTFRGCDAVYDYREIIAREDIDAVCIATPDHWHAIPVIEACQAGKDVYCEKPLTLTIREAERCVAAARKYDRVVQTGSQQRSNVFGQFREAVEFIRSGRLGKISRVTVGVGGPSKSCDLPEEEIEPGLEWDMWLGPAPSRPYNSILSPRGMHDHFPRWRDYREYSGGGHTDMGAHHYDIAQWALGYDDSGPVEIIPPADPDSGIGVRYVYADGVEMVHGGPGGCVFHGERGTLHIDRGVLTSDPEEIITTPLADDDVHLPVSPGHHRNWLDSIASRNKPIADVEVGARTVTIAHLGNLAYWNRRSFRWKPETWSFADPADNHFLDRPRRDPWHLPDV